MTGVLGQSRDLPDTNPIRGRGREMVEPDLGKARDRRASGSHAEILDRRKAWGYRRWEITKARP